MAALRKLVGVVAALSLACAASHHPPPLPEPEDASKTRAEFATWVVGVKEPVPRFLEDDDPAPSTEDELRDSARLIGALRRTELFAQVDFTKQLGRAPDLELAVQARKGEGVSSAPLWLAPLTLSIVVLESDDGFAFRTVGPSADRFELPYPTTFVVGLLPLVASPVLITGAFPTWSLGGGRSEQDLTAFLLANAGRLRAFYRGPSSPGQL